jgi:hypothetical protein
MSDNFLIEEMYVVLSYIMLRMEGNTSISRIIFYPCLLSLYRWKRLNTNIRGYSFQNLFIFKCNLLVVMNSVNFKRCVVNGTFVSTLFPHEFDNFRMTLLPRNISPLVIIIGNCPRTPPPPPRPHFDTPIRIS